MEQIPIAEGDELFAQLDLYRDQILKRLADFRNVPEQHWLREILLCLLTPQSSPIRAEACMSELTDKGFFNGALAVQEVSGILRTPHIYVRFHNVKAKRLCRLREQWPTLREKLKRAQTPQEERRVLVAEVDGLGWKEASHALRNIGRRDLAILDRHILRKLVALNVIAQMPKALTERRYHEIENAFRNFALKHREDLDVLDLYFWASGTGFIFK